MHSRIVSAMEHVALNGVHGASLEKSFRILTNRTAWSKNDEVEAERLIADRVLPTYEERKGAVVADIWCERRRFPRQRSEEADSEVERRL